MELETCRHEIDRLDQELTKLLEARMKIVAQVAAYKKEHHLEIYDPRRERAEPCAGHPAGVGRGRELFSEF